MKRFKRFLIEGGKSGGTRYNTELASLLSLTNKQKGLDGFDPKDPNFEPFDWFNPDKLYNGNQVRTEILKFLPRNYNESKFKSFYDSSMGFKSKILAQSQPKVFTWIGGSNATGADANPSDVEYVNNKLAGISIKDNTGITLSNLTPKSIGLTTPKGVDAIKFYSHTAPSLFPLLKRKVIRETLKEVSAKNPKFVPDSKSAYYNIEYIDKNNYKINSKKSSLIIDKKHFDNMSDDDISKSSELHSVFGAYLTSNVNKFRPQIRALYNTVAKEIVPIIQNKMADSASIMRLLNLSPQPYIYQNPKHIYYVPSRQEFLNTELELKDIKFSDTLKASGVLLTIQVGIKGKKEYATIDLWLRYGNRAYGANSTVRLQSIKNPENIAWKLL